MRRFLPFFLLACNFSDPGTTLSPVSSGTPGLPDTTSTSTVDTSATDTAADTTLNLPTTSTSTTGGPAGCNVPCQESEDCPGFQKGVCIDNVCWNNEPFEPLCVDVGPCSQPCTSADECGGTGAKCSSGTGVCFQPDGVPFCLEDPPCTEQWTCTDVSCPVGIGATCVGQNTGGGGKCVFENTGEPVCIPPCNFIECGPDFPPCPDGYPCSGVTRLCGFNACISPCTACATDADCGNLGFSCIEGQCWDARSPIVYCLGAPL